jgi:acyl-CoA hydrolase
VTKLRQIGPCAQDELGGNSPFGQNPLLTVDVVQKELKRVDPLNQTALELGPIRCGDEPRDEAEGKDFLAPSGVGIDREGDPLIEERQLRQVLTTSELGGTPGGQLMDDVAELGPGLAVWTEQLVVGIFGDAVVGEQLLRRIRHGSTVARTGRQIHTRLGSTAMGSMDSERIEAGRLTECRLIEMVFPEQTNHYGTLFGGEGLALMDKAAFVTASRYARRAVVTARSEKVDFRIPVRQGQLVELVARIVSTGQTSMTVDVELFSEDLLTGERQLATGGRFVMVALNEEGRPAEVPALAR